MKTGGWRRWLIGAAGVAILLVVLVTVGLHVGAKALERQVTQALGPESEVGEIRLALTALEIVGLRIRAPAGWPAAETLRAERIRITPDLGGLLSGQLKISRIRIDGGYVSALRTADGRLRVVPSLLEKPPGKDEPGPQLTIGAIELHGAALDFFDVSVRRPAHRVRLEGLDARVTDLQLPDLTARSKLHLDGVVRGVRTNGRILVDGWMVFASRESVLKHQLRDIDLLALQPYLLESAETGVKRGTLDLDLDSTIRGGQLRAPGVLTLNGLELASSGTFMGLPRAGVVGLMKDGNGRIRIRFVLEGRLDDPDFRLNEGFSTRVASSLGGLLGISLEGLARGAGSLGQKGVEAAGSAAEGVGRAVKGLFGR